MCVDETLYFLRGMKRARFRTQLCLVLSLLSCVTSGPFLNLSEPPWPQPSLRECHPLSGLLLSAVV